MAILYNLDPLSAIGIFYRNEKNGVWNGEIIKNEKKRGLILPQALKDFLENYGYFKINQNERTFRLLFPDDIKIISLQTDEGDISVMIIGFVDGHPIGIISDREELPTVIGQEYAEENRRVMEWRPLGGSFSAVLTAMFLTELFESDEHCGFEGEYDIKSALAENGMSESEICPSQNCPERFSLNFNDESDTFIVAEFDGDSDEMVYLHTVPLKPISFEELNRLFDTEFYQNSLHCDFEHALQLQTEIIKRIEAMRDFDSLEAAAHYKLAARCCWALKRLSDAEAWYNKGLPAVERSLEAKPETAADYYTAMADFYAEACRYERSDEYYDKALDIIRQFLPDDAYKAGMLYQQKAFYSVQNKRDIDPAIELYGKALEEFQKKPKDCKYDTARVQQLRGEARRLKKELSRK